MAVLFVILLAIGGIVAIRVVLKRERKARFEADSAANPVEPMLAEVLDLDPDAHWERRRDIEASVRAATPEVLASLRAHGEAPLLIVHSNGVAFPGLLVITQGRTLFFGRRGNQTIPHAGAETKIMASGPHDPSPFVEITGQGTVQVETRSITTAQRICGVIDMWAENPQAEPDPRIVVTRHRVVIPDAFYVDLLRGAGHQPHPFNLRSIHERFGMQTILKARNHIEAVDGALAAERFVAGVGRPDDDRDLPLWTTRVLEAWVARYPDDAAVIAATPLLVRAMLLEFAREGGYLSRPGRPLPMWQNTRYENGSGRRIAGDGRPPVRA